MEKKKTHYRNDHEEHSSHGQSHGLRLHGLPIQQLLGLKKLVFLDFLPLILVSWNQRVVSQVLGRQTLTPALLMVVGAPVIGGIAQGLLVFILIMDRQVCLVHC